MLKRLHIFGGTALYGAELKALKTFLINSLYIRKVSQFLAPIEYPIRAGGHNHHPLSENQDFSITEPPLDLRPVCKFEFVRCGPVEKKLELSICLSFNRGGLTKFEDAFYKSVNKFKSSGP